MKESWNDEKRDGSMRRNGCSFLVSRYRELRAMTQERPLRVKGNPVRNTQLGNRDLRHLTLTAVWN